MTNRSRGNGKTEILIETCRSEAQWLKVIVLAEDLLRLDATSNRCLANFLIAEGKLESYLESNPPIEANFGKAKTGLSEAKGYLESVIGEEGHQAGIKLDAHLLLAKLFYACGHYEKCLENFKLAELTTLSEKHLSPRSLRILADSFAIKGLCLEAYGLKGQSKFQVAEAEADMIKCFERASDLGLLCLQGQDNTQTIHTLNGGVMEVRRMGAVLETALQRAPIVLIKAGKLQMAIERYRMMLAAVETKTTQTLRLTLARQLAEVLLRGVSGTIYTPPANLSPARTQNQKGLWQPKKYAGRNQFIPLNQHEETILLLLIAEALAVRDAVLSQSPEFRAARMHALGNATAIYDLLTLATVRWGQIGLLHESFEKALKFSFNEQHMWRQYSLCLVSLGKHAQALSTLLESAKLTTGDNLAHLMAARLCYESLGLMRQGLGYANDALRRETKYHSTGSGPATRAQLYVGIGLQQLAISSNLKSEKDKYGKMALEAFEKAVQQDARDHLCEYYLAWQYALTYNIGEALHHVRNALALRTEHAPSLHLFALLLTANRKPRDALFVLDDAVVEFPDNLSLLHLKAHLELYLQNAETALLTVQKMLQSWREQYEAQTLGVDNEALEKQSDTRSVMHAPSQISDKDSNSVHAASLAASRVEQALSEAASSMSSFSPRPGPQKAWMIQLKIWLLLADVYLVIDQPNEALNCIQEASLINPMSHQLLFMRGQVHLHQSQLMEAKQCFLNAVSANPYHTEALRSLGEVHHLMGEPRLAEKTLKDAVKIDPNSPEIWFTLGQVAESLGDYNASADCLATALQLEPACPVLPFTTIGLTFE